MTPHEFIAKWKAADLSERSACHQHFLDLCELVGHRKPAEVDPDGTWFTFEKGVEKTTGGKGFADVWKRDGFGWEYKGKHRDLKAAYEQLLLYREALQNPPLLVVCDLDRFEVHTNFTGTVKRVYAFDLDRLAEPANLDVLRKVFHDPDALRPDQTMARITEEAAAQFTLLADGLRVRGVLADEAAHFLMKLIFCLFAEDIDLLRAHLFTDLLEKGAKEPARLAVLMRELFEKMSTGGDFGLESIAHFNGGLFADADVIELTPDEIRRLAAVSRYDWGDVEPSIFGTLFERLLDPSKRSQIGAHYTSRHDILTLVEPVLMAPLRREWADVQANCEKLEAEAVKVKTRQTKRRKFAQRDRTLQDFVERLGDVTVLDPACGSGNFLYVAINLLLDLQKEVIAYAAAHGSSLLPQVRPTQLHGIEVNPYAQQLAQVVIWIGYLQWMHHNGFSPPRDPVLAPIESIELRDAILDLSDSEHPKEPEWPAADVIVGNPPFLGSKFLRDRLGDEYVDAQFEVYDGSVERNADLCCYWIEKARRMIAGGNLLRAGLLATQGIRGGASRETLKRVKEAGDIFFAVSDRDWVLDGAMVHVSMVGFDAGGETGRLLDGESVTTIHSNLTSGADITRSVPLSENRRIAFQGVTPRGRFEVHAPLAYEMLTQPLNANGKPNSDVIRRWANGSDLIEGRVDEWVIDFGCGMCEADAALYQMPFEYVKEHVLPARKSSRTGEAADTFWLHWRPRPAMRAAIESVLGGRFLVTPRVAKYRLFIWVGCDWLPSDATNAFAVDDDFSFGILQSRIHQVWSLAQGTQLRERESGFRYTPTTCFETFPFPEPTSDQEQQIAQAAAELDRLRTGWLNPPEWTREEVLEFPGSVDGPWARYVHQPDERGIGTVRYPRLVPKDEECAKELKRRTLTNLYNQRPTWLAHAHEKLDEAVAAACNWPADLSDEQLLQRLLELNLQRAADETANT